MGENLDTVKLERIKRCVESIEKHFENEPERLQDIEVSFEYIIGSFFPQIMDNIKIEMTRKYIEGFNSGQNFLPITSFPIEEPLAAQYIKENKKICELMFNNFENARRCLSEEDKHKIDNCYALLNILQDYFKVLIGEEI